MSLLVILAGCSGSAEDTASADSDAKPETTTTDAPTTTTTAAPTTTVDPMVAAQALYFGLTAESNAAIENAYNDVAEADGMPWADVPGYCRRIAELDEQFVRDLKAYAWPPDVQDEVDAAVSTLAAEAGQYFACANAEGTFEAQSPLVEATDAASNANDASLSALRVSLGLSTDR